ncbi:MAG TPA: valine--tRNA ligase [Deltaproteobacteria bacterium]|nr:valine--tRNA ligase [Deltaproteobacteria bacterium]
MAVKSLEKVYDPAAVERRWSEYWIEEGLTRADVKKDAEPFSMVIPPPNITGTLHLGHALNVTLQDILARYRRMEGRDVLWLPGIDHAGIATQNVVERRLAAEGTDRHALGRERFVERVWRWKEESGGTIINQLKRLGASCDWSRLRFTMDEGLSRAVREVFARLYGEGLIYRGDYIINWCPRCLTALSDLEVQAEETAGKLWYMEYPLRDGPDGRTGVASLVVATTRPETMLGDTAVAVNPADERFRGVVGRTVRLPLAGRDIPVVADESVDMEFGTGAVKITPAHDFNDFETAKRHGLDMIRIMDERGVMNENAGAYAGLDRFEARERVVADLEALGLLRRVEDHRLMLGSCYRCHTVVEPTLSKQWFVKVAPLAAPAVEAVEKGRTRFIPRNWENLYFDWMRNIRDWCISRQIWWGHRIPAWYCAACDHVTVAARDPDRCERCGCAEIRQDEDVLDTWFSSALWPFSTLGWPERTEELRRYYPTSVLSTSFDIIFFWVARMMMMGLKFMGEVPFRHVYIHALIRDAEGRKMSKSRGNVIDPLVMMEKYGTDALRFTLAVLAAQGRDIKLAEERIEGYRNFCNKLWNLARFTLMNVDAAAAGGGAEYGRAERWVKTRLGRCRDDVASAIDAYRFDDAAKALYRFVWHELCDWYVELVKPDLRGERGDERQRAASAALVSVLGDTLKLLHPFMPFITEEIWSYLPGSRGPLMTAALPRCDERWEDDAAAMDRVMDVIRAVRNVRTEMNIRPTAELDCTCLAADAAAREVLAECEPFIRRLARVGRLTVAASGDRPSDAVSVVTSDIEVLVRLGGLVDVEKETKRLEREIGKVGGELAGVEKKLANRSFLEKAPAEVVEKEKNRLEELRARREKLASALRRIEGLGG